MAGLDSVRLEATPRPGVYVGVHLEQRVGSGIVVGIITINNDSTSPFLFRASDLSLYIDGGSVRQIVQPHTPLEFEVAPGEDFTSGNGYDWVLSSPTSKSTGISYTPSDSASDRHTWLTETPGGPMMSWPSRTTSSTTAALTAANVGPAHDFFRGLTGDGYVAYKLYDVQEGETRVKIVGVRVDADKKTRTTYDAIYKHATSSAKQHGLWTSSGWRLRVVLVEATAEQKIIESRDFDLTGGEG